MSTATPPQLMTVEEFLALPDDGIERDLIHGVDDCLNSGVQLVWIVDPHFHTVVIHRPGRKPELFNDDQQLTGDDVLPEFNLAVSELFA